MLFLQVTAKLPSSAVEATPPLFPTVYVTTTILSTPVSCKSCMLGRMCKVVRHMNIAREFPCKNSNESKGKQLPMATCDHMNSTILKHLSQQLGYVCLDNQDNCMY